MSRKTPQGQFFPFAANDLSFLTRPPLLRSESEREFSRLLSAYVLAGRFCVKL
jgi:hypothetical protein